jgi:hypothetical protein
MKKKLSKNDADLIRRANKIERRNWSYINLLIDKAEAEEVKTILLSLQSTYKTAHEILDYQS